MCPAGGGMTRVTGTSPRCGVFQACAERSLKCRAFGLIADQGTCDAST